MGGVFENNRDDAVSPYADENDVRKECGENGKMICISRGEESWGVSAGVSPGAWRGKAS